MEAVSYVCVRPYKGKNLLGIDIEIPENTILPVDKGVLCYIRKEKNSIDIIPVCYQHSQVAHDYFVWNNAFEQRKEIMEKIKDLFPLNKAQIETVWSEFSYLLNENCDDSIIFNRYYYFGSYVSELKHFYDKMISLKD